ncbi:ACSF2 isoform 23, partial [Pan troglodytes]
MAVYVGMLRLGRLCAGSSGVLGARAALSRSWQEARLQGVRFLSSREVDRMVSMPIGGLSYVQGCTKKHLNSKTVGQCLETTAQRVPEREALVVLHEDVRLTFAQLKEEVDKAASGLLSIGLCKGVCEPSLPGYGTGVCPQEGGLQGPCVPQAIQDPAILQHPEADLSRRGECPARGLEESEAP